MILKGALEGFSMGRQCAGTPPKHRNGLKLARAVTAATALSCLLPAMLAGQWLHYRTPGIPRLPNGKPNLNAPAPRTASGHPDLSGMWLPPTSLPCPKVLQSDTGSCAETLRPSAQATDIGAGLAGGLPYRPWAAALVKQRTANLGRDDPHVRCLPLNYPRAYAMPHIQKFIQTPGLLAILDEFNASYRQIFTDGRALPEDPQPSWNGYSTGHWEGDTLVVNTIGFRDDLWLDLKGDPLTEAAKITERLRRPNFGKMEVEVSVDDPKAYTKPWTVTFALAIVVDTEMIDEICLENEKSYEHLITK
jgi:hypothetical protein